MGWLVAITGCWLCGAGDVFYFQHSSMGTSFEIRLYTAEGGEEGARGIADAAFAAVDALEAKISRWRDDSEISRINRKGGSGWVPVSDETWRLARLCKTLYGETEGAFDPTVGVLMELWGFYRKEGRVPPESELRSAIERVGFDKVLLAEDRKEIRFSRDYMALDFGGIGKGYALDRAADILRRRGVASALLSAGTSTLVAIGAPPGERGWKAQIRDSDETVYLKDEALSTSGGYERFFELNGRKYCHIINPKTGRPLEGIWSASAIAPTGAESDALSTAFFVMGADKAEVFCRARQNIRAVLVTQTGGGKG